MTLDKMQKRPYSIEPYNPEWVLKFIEIKKILEKVFGSKAIAIEHIGSTSIPGMSAKPVIDVLVTVEKMEPFTTEREEMTKYGYQNGDNYIAPETIIFFKTEEGDRKTENIHVCVKNSPKAIRFITTRDYLRVHPEKAKEYSQLKEELQKKYPHDYPAYREAKDSFVNEIGRLTDEWLKK
jgi:GrpB-like predicted nucleotidyltransferase (UPF0157 family)